MSVQMLRNVIWTRFFMKPVCWQNLVVIFTKSYPPHMTSFLAEFWSVCRHLSQESKKIEFAAIGCLQLQILNFEWTKVNTGRMRDLTLKDVISMLFVFLFFLTYISMHKTSTEGQICQLPPIYSFLHLSSKGAFKT